MTHTIEASTSVLSQLASPAVRSLLLAGVTGLAIRAFRVRASSLRMSAWTAVLYAAMAMPLLGWILPPFAVPVPAFFENAGRPRNAQDSRILVAPVASDASSRKVSKTTNRGAQSGVFDQASLFVRTEPRTALLPASQPPISWNTLALAIYLAVTLALLSRLVVGVIFSRRLIRASQVVSEARVTVKLASRAYACRIKPKPAPHVAESQLISVPVTMGALRSTILLPANWREWDDAKLDAVLAHEVSHVARRDALTQRLSLIHRAVFWFSPLAWWLDRQLAELAEQASDEAALLGGADRHEYARTLLGFFEALQTAPGRVWWQGVSMAKAGQAEQRLERILAWKGVVAMSLKKSVLVAIIALAVPVLYVTASVRPGANPGQNEQAQVPTAPSAPRAAAAPSAPRAASELPQPALAPSAPATASQAPAAVGAVAASGSLWPPPAAAPTAPVAAVAPVPPSAPWPYQSSSASHSHGYSYSYGDDDEQRFVIVSGKSDSLTMSGSSEDARHAEKLKKQIPGDFIWFERDEQSYIIRDQATIDRARKLWAAQEELGKKQEDLGKQQEALGKQQEELGKKMEQVQVKVPDMTAELDRLRAKLQKLGPNATMEQLGDLQSEIGDLQSKIGDVQSAAGEQQSKLGEQMGALGEKQGKLGELQGELAEKASREMKALLDEAIKKGTAQPEPQGGGGASL